GLGRRRDVASQLEDATVGTGTIPKVALSLSILTCRFRKANARSSTGHIPHLLAAPLPTPFPLLMLPKLSFFPRVFPTGPPTIPNITPSLHSTLFRVLLFTSRLPRRLRSCSRS